MLPNRHFCCPGVCLAQNSAFAFADITSETLLLVSVLPFYGGGCSHSSFPPRAAGPAADHCGLIAPELPWLLAWRGREHSL